MFSAERQARLHTAFICDIALQPDGGLAILSEHIASGCCEDGISPIEQLLNEALTDAAGGSNDEPGLSGHVGYHNGIAESGRSQQRCLLDKARRLSSAILWLTVSRMQIGLLPPVFPAQAILEQGRGGGDRRHDAGAD